jgi:hypothetical protein
VDRLIETGREAVARVFEPGKTVLLAGATEYFNFLRYSRVLRGLGLKTVCLTLTRDARRFKEPFFDAALDAGGHYEVFFALLNAFPYAVVHFQGWMNNHHLAAAAALLSERPFVADLNDIPHFFLAPEDHDRVFGQGVFAREDHSLRVLLGRADGLALNCSAPFVERLLGMLDIRRDVPWTPFHGWPLPEFFRDATRWDRHALAFPGSLVPTGFPDAAFADGKVIRLAAECLLPQGLSLHVFGNPLAGSGLGESFWDYQTLAAGEPGFKVHPGLPPDRLAEVLSGLGWGNMCYLLDNGFRVLMDHYASLIPTKAFTMLEAGLPLVCNREFDALGAMVEEHGLGICVTQDELRTSLRRMIDGCDYPALRANVRRFRERFSMPNRIKDLIDIYRRAGADLPDLAVDRSAA